MDPVTTDPAVIFEGSHPPEAGPSAPFSGLFPFSSLSPTFDITSAAGTHPGQEGFPAKHLLMKTNMTAKQITAITGKTHHTQDTVELHQVHILAPSFLWLGLPEPIILQLRVLSNLTRQAGKRIHSFQETFTAPSMLDSNTESLAAEMSFKTLYVISKFISAICHPRHGTRNSL